VRVAGVILAIGLGLASGWLVHRIPIRPIAQDIGATLIGWVVGCFTVGAVAFVWLIFFHLEAERGGLGAVSLGLSETIVIGLPIAVLLAIVARTALARTGPARLASQSPILLGGLGALLGALWVATTITYSSS